MISFKIKHFFLLVFTGTVLLMACKKAAVKPDETKLQPEKFTYTANVYAAGYTLDSMTFTKQAAYWKNGISFVLTTGINGGNANAIVVKDNDVYVCGRITETNGVSVACYWKNGVITKLEDNSIFSSAVDIFISGNDIYITGSVGNNAVYWKNGTRLKLALSPLYNSARALGIAVIGSDVYVSGYQSSPRNAATFWKNGSPTILQGNAAFAGNIEVRNQDIYIAANYETTLTSSETINYWKNGTPVIIPDKALLINTMKVAVNGDDVYVYSNTKNGPAYYKMVN